ncbi:hypothetical protein HCN44_003817 [Aphidius gifuensis]|uniref:Attractin/MKLN-like beta-propeller domain-containing protein n=1 Tax=Aphidius gifuensis TaxID=684658 RepID=A0A834XYC0_APHGI|nr:tip elongation aberrant protein 1-like [Aphidius gifuensis]KAF7994345.1 hypothetical protein HCN44_003817 [Aphidius gifuensis]
MWSSVTAAGTENGPAPSSRSKHSATLLGGHIYLLGGRNGNLPLKDLWRYSLAESRWEELRPSGDKPPALQEHSVVSYKDCLYVFGGELGFSAGTETPLWIYTVKTNCWRKIKAQRGCAVPRGRRGHTALVHRGQMLIYGGYQDLRGSSSELWSFHFETESWHLLSSSSSSSSGGSNNNNSNNNNDGSFGPAPRHKHTAILDCDSMYIYGGMTDLQERNDCWKWDINTCTWFSIKLKNKQTPGPLHGHAACRLPSCMLIFGGESNGTSTNELWRFHFTSETWDKLTISGTKPQPRSESIALAVSELVIRGCGIQNNNNNNNNRQKTTTSTSTRCGQHKPRFSLAGAVNYNKVSPCEPPTRPSFLREISKLSQINLSRLSHPNKCSYSVLNGQEEHDHDGDDDDDDVNNYNDSYDDDDYDYDDDNNDTKIIKEKDNNSYYPFQQVDNEVAADNKNSRMVKSRSANAIGKRIRQRSCIINNNNSNKNKKNHHNQQQQQQQTTSFCNNDYGSFNNRMTREPISVPNFRSLTLPTPILTPVEAARLVFVDPDDNSDNDNDNDKNNQSTKLINLTEEEKSDFELFHEACQPTRGESYHSHLYEAATTTTTIQSPKTPLSSLTTTKLPTSASVRFADLEEGEESTSDYASNDARSPGDQLAVDDDYCSLDTILNKKKSSLKNRDNNNIRDGQFGFCNPNYFGVDTSTTTTTNNDNSNKFVKILNNSSPDSLLDDKTGRSVSQTFAELLELQEIKPRIPPKSLKLDNSPSRRAVSASRAERQKAKLQASCQTTTTTTTPATTPAPFNVFIIGGKEKGQAAVFSRPVSLWKLQLGSHIF